MGNLMSFTSSQPKAEFKEEWDKPLFNRYDPYVIKGKLDEYITHELNTTYNYTQTFSYSNAKLLIGFISIIFTLICHVYEYLFNAHFPKDYNITVVCVIGYFTFNLLYQWFEYYYEKETFYQGDVKVKGVKSVDISSTIKKFDKHITYTIFIYSDAKSPITVSHTRSVELFFNEQGYLVKSAINTFIKELTKSITSKQN